MNVMSLLLDCISMARHANAIIYSCQTLMNLVEFHESSQEMLREARYARILRDVLLTAGKGCVITWPALCLFNCWSVMRSTTLRSTCGC